MKVRASIRSLAKQPGSKVVRRRGHTYVINKKNPRLKARQGRAAPWPPYGGHGERCRASAVVERGARP